MTAKTDFKFYIFKDSSIVQPFESGFKEYIRILQLDGVLEPEGEYDLTEKTGIKLENSLNYGKSAGLFWVWKNSKADYIGFTMDNNLPTIEYSELTDTFQKGYSCVGIKHLNLQYTLRETYRSDHYDYDLRILADVIKHSYPLMAECFENLLRKNRFLIPSIIMRKDLFKKMCVWLFSVLERVSAVCKQKVSAKENRYLEYLTVYLINLYVEYNSEKYKFFFVERYSGVITIGKVTDGDISNCERFYGDILGRAQKLVNDGKPEMIQDLIGKSADHRDNAILTRVYENYKRQKRYYQETDLDKNISIADQARAIEGFTPKATGKILLFRWNSINDGDVLEALEKYGYKVDYLGVGDINYLRQADTAGVANAYLDSHENEYDFVFSVNYFDDMAEACYVHNVPYIAWAYDSPTDLGCRKKLGFDTTHVFLFDSEEAFKEKRERKFAHVEYLPLAANTEKYDNIEITAEDKEKYTADISFIGQLYANKMNEYMNCMTDYQKAFFNALIDYNVGKYNNDIIHNVVSIDSYDWLSDKRLINEIFKVESHAESFAIEDKSPGAIIGKILVRSNQTVTNRERLILISMLANHWDLKLYSTSSHEVFTNVNECGVIDYYTDAPKAFKLSKINLNITLKTITSGIPLRCLDIMGCGGFLLSNHQRDFDEHFKDGVNIALFNSLEEAYDKCKFYLEHDTERKKVALNGYETVKKYYSYNYLFDQMVRRSGLDYLLDKTVK